jgi:peptide/nickel transport system substrate-binding protein
MRSVRPAGLSISLRLQALLLAVVIWVAVACTSNQSGPTEGPIEGGGASGGTLRVGVAEGIVDLDPHTSTLLGDQQILENVYRGLTALDPETNEPVGEIAKSWKVSDDELTWTFSLRPSVEFHNGKTVTAADVKYSLERIVDPKTKATAASDFEPIQSITAVNPQRVQIHLKHPYSILPLALQLPAWSAIIPKGSGDSLVDEPIGTGPFRFVGQQQEASVTLKAFDDYWKEKLPYLDGIQFRVIPEESARLSALLSEQIDFVPSVPLTQAKRLQSQDTVRVIKFQSSWVDEFGMNTAEPPFDDVRVRQAVALALNKQEIATSATFGLGGAIDTMVSPASPVPVEVEGLQYDPDRARELLAQAGYPNGFDLTFAPCGGNVFPQMSRAGEVIADQLNAVGINSSLETLEAGVWADQVITKGDYQAFICGLVNGLDPDGHTYRYFRSDGVYNFSNYEGTPRLDHLLQQGREVQDPAQRSAIYERAWTILAQEVPWIPLYWVPGLMASTSDVTGFRPLPEFNLRFEYVQIVS